MFVEGISNVKSRESLVMAYSDNTEDPFSSAPFSLPSKFFILIITYVLVRKVFDPE